MTFNNIKLQYQHSSEDSKYLMKIIDKKSQGYITLNDYLGFIVEALKQQGISEEWSYSFLPTPANTRYA